jgi:hypothetical protein
MTEPKASESQNPLTRPANQAQPENTESVPPTVETTACGLKIMDNGEGEEKEF